MNASEYSKGIRNEILSERNEAIKTDSVFNKFRRVYYEVFAKSEVTPENREIPDFLPSSVSFTYV